MISLYVTTGLSRALPFNVTDWIYTFAELLFFAATINVFPLASFSDMLPNRGLPSSRLRAGFGHVAPARVRRPPRPQESFTLVHIQVQGPSQALDRVGIGESPHASLEIGDGARTHAGPFGELLLCESRRCPVASQQLPEPLLLIHMF